MPNEIINVGGARVSGPLAPLAVDFRSTLLESGYRSWRKQLFLMGHVSLWLEERGLSAADLDSRRVREYLSLRRVSGYTTLRSRQGLEPLVSFLADRGVTIAETEEPVAAAERLLARFGRYLLDERGLAPSTMGYYQKRARRFLARCAPDGEMGGVTAGDVTGAVLAECARVSPGSTQFFVSALRAFLRFCYLDGMTEVDLSVAALGVTGRRPSWLPKGMSAPQVRGLLDSCDRSRTAGRRNYAVLLLLARLGLRAGEVAALRLDDIDWRAGQFVVRGKGSRLERLPLPVDVGEAIAAYLEQGRPRTRRREVFLSLDAPVRGLGYMAVSSVVRRACQRAGIPPQGAHRLRHTLAVDMMAAGASLPEIGQVLRHRTVSATAVYARVDLDRLRTIAQPWPAGSTR
jgi:site-specific recombinase XerD